LYDNMLMLMVKTYKPQQMMPRWKKHFRDFDESWETMQPHN
jgi:hypothetical protein